MADSTDNKIRGRFDNISASESAATIMATGTPMSLSATFPAVGGSNPPHQLVIRNLNVTSTGLQCVRSSDMTVRFRNGSNYFSVGGILTAANTAVNTGCEVNITQAATRVGQVAKAEIRNCVILSGSNALHVFSGKFALTVPATTTSPSSGNCARTGTAITFPGGGGATGKAPHTSSVADSTDNKIRGRFDNISASESAATIMATGTPMSLSATFPAVGGSNPPHQLVIRNLNVTSTGLQCVRSSDMTVRFRNGSNYFSVGGILTAANTAVNTGCEVNITQAATRVGQVAKAEIRNCVILSGSNALHVFSGKFALTVRRLPFTLTSSQSDGGFNPGGVIPTEFKYRISGQCATGSNSFPKLVWSNVPAGTKSFVLIVEDPVGSNWVHLNLYNIPKTVVEIPKITDSSPTNHLTSFSAYGSTGQTSWSTNGWGGPCPPNGTGKHTYFFKLYAMRIASISAINKLTRSAFESANSSNIISSVSISGTSIYP